MNKPAWIVVGVVITLLDSSLRGGERAGFGLAGLGVRGRSS
jgi:hypothetical protein